MTPVPNDTAHIVVDMLYDFIDGSLACLNAQNSVDNSVDYINSNPVNLVLYICDSHPPDHCSFKENGGIWPPHCIKGTHGAEIHSSFYTKIADPKSRPNKTNTLNKGEDAGSEQYSGFHAASESGDLLVEHLKKEGVKKIIISGITTEYCVNETASELLSEGFQVTILSNALAYVNYQRHIEVLEALKIKGAVII